MKRRWMLGSLIPIEPTMFRTTSFARPFAAGGLLAIVAASPACATEEDTQFWTTFAVAAPVAPRLDTLIEISPRARSAEVGEDQLVTRLFVDYRLTPRLTVGGGLGYVEAGDSREWRTHQQLLVNTGPLTFRTRLEERMFNGADRLELRLRQRVQLGVPLTERLSVSGAAEMLALVQTRNSGEDARIESWRALFTLRQRITRQIEASAGYLLILAPREGGEDRLSHVPQIAFTLRP
jgi:hypothetical protein